MMRLRLYDRTNSTLVTASGFDGTLTKARGRTGVRQHNDLGQGRFTVDRQHPQHDLLAKELVVRWEEWNGDQWVLKHASIVEEDPTVLWVPEDEGEPGTTFSGPSLTGWLDRAIVWPDPDFDGPSLRPFGWSERDFDDGANPEPDSSGTQGAPTDPDLAGLPDGWVDPVGEWVGGDGPVTWLRRKMDVPNAGNPDGKQGPSRIFVCANSDFDVEILGHRFSGSAWQIASRDITVPNDVMTCVIRMENDAEAPRALMAIVRRNADGTIGGLTYRSFTTGVFGTGDPERWELLNNPVDAPGTTVGFVLKTLVEEAQARGSLAGLTLGFDAVEDSAGVPWPETVIFDFRTKTSLLWVARQLYRWGCDFEVSPLGVLNAWVSRGADLTATVTLTPPTGGDVGDFFRYRVTGPRIGGNALLYETPGGFAVAEDTTSISALGRLEDGIEVGTGPDPESLGPAIASQLAESADPSRDHHVDLTMATDLLDDVDLGDTVNGWADRDTNTDVRLVQVSWSQEDQGGAVRRQAVFHAS